MERRHLIAMLLSGALISGVVPASDDHWEAHRLRQSGAILPLETILESVRSVQPGRILEVKLETEHGGYIYDIELLDDYGRVWELEIDAVSGRILKTELED